MDYNIPRIIFQLVTEVPAVVSFVSYEKWKGSTPYSIPGSTQYFASCRLTFLVAVGPLKVSGCLKFKVGVDFEDGPVCDWFHRVVVIGILKFITSHIGPPKNWFGSQGIIRGSITSV